MGIAAEWPNLPATRLAPQRAGQSFIIGRRGPITDGHIGLTTTTRRRKTTSVSERRRRMQAAGSQTCPRPLVSSRASPASTLTSTSATDAASVAPRPAGPLARDRPANYWNQRSRLIFLSAGNLRRASPRHSRDPMAATEGAPARPIGLAQWSASGRSAAVARPRRGRRRLRSDRLPSRGQSDDK